MFGLRWVLGLLGLLLLINGAVLGLARRAPAQSAYILFHADYKALDTFQLYRMGANGGDVRRVSPLIIRPIHTPQISPDGRRIIVTTRRGRDQQFYTLQLFGQRALQLTANYGDYGVVRWSPDGRHLAYSKDLPDGGRIFTLDLRSGIETAISLPRVFPTALQWSPDGAWLVYVRRMSGHNLELYRMAADGSDPQSLSVVYHTGLSWSPAGDAFAFSMRVSYEYYAIYRLDWPDGSVTHLTGQEGMSYAPQWSPDGEWIAFYSDREDYNSLYKMRPDGSDVQRLTDFMPAVNPQWSPDGEWLLFRASPSHINFNLYKIRADGSGFTQLTEDNSYRFFPVWLPIIDLPYRLWALLLAGTLALLGGIWGRDRQT